MFDINVNDAVGVAANWLGLFSPILLFWTWLMVRRTEKRNRSIYDTIKNNPGKRPAILIVSTLREERDIRNQVENYRQQHETLKNIEKERVFTITLADVAGNATELTPDHVPRLASRLQEEVGKIYRNATDVVHYFHGGPFPVAAMVGAQFSNGPQVKLYHWNVKSSTYENWGMLRHFPAL